MAGMPFVSLLRDFFSRLLARGGEQLNANRPELARSNPHAAFSQSPPSSSQPRTGTITLSAAPSAWPKTLRGEGSKKCVWEGGGLRKHGHGGSPATRRESDAPASSQPCPTAGQKPRATHAAWFGGAGGQQGQRHPETRHKRAVSPEKQVQPCQEHGEGVLPQPRASVAPGDRGQPGWNVPTRHGTFGHGMERSDRIPGPGPANPQGSEQSAPERPISLPPGPALGRNPQPRSPSTPPRPRVSPYLPFLQCWSQ